MSVEIAPDPEREQRVRLKWAEALESGKHMQGQAYLRMDELDEQGEPTGRILQCCLDVLNDVCRADGLDLPEPVKPSSCTHTRVYEYTFFNAVGTEYSENALLPEMTMRYAGIDDATCPLDVGSGFRTEATVLNDGEGWTFPQIAAAIRRTFKLPPQEETSGESPQGQGSEGNGQSEQEPSS